MNEWEQQQPVDGMTTSPNDPNISFKHIGLLAGIIIVPLIIIGVVLPFIPKQKTPQIRIADNSVVLPSPSPTSTIAIAVLAFVKGDVQVKKGEIWISAAAEDEIAQSDVIKTSFDSQATLLFGSGSMVRVDQNSQIALSEYSRDGDSWIIKINQIFGRSWNRVQKLIGGSVYEVDTPTAVATVRGTAFGVDADASGSAVTVDEGTVSAKLVDAKSPDRKIISEVQIHKQEQIEITPQKVEEVKKAIEERRPIAQIVEARKTEKLPEWIEEHKREIIREAPKIEELKIEMKKKVERKEIEIKREFEKKEGSESAKPRFDIPEKSRIPEKIEQRIENKIENKLEERREEIKEKVEERFELRPTPTPTPYIQRTISYPTPTPYIKTEESRPTPTPIKIDSDGTNRLINLKKEDLDKKLKIEIASSKKD